MRVINEPTAAAIAYGLNKDGPETKVLVYDLGGGTFDVSILGIEDKVFEVLSTSGDTHLGGEDFDNRVIDWVVKTYEKKYGVDEGAVAKNQRAMGKLKKAVENAKRGLSAQQSVKIEIEGFEGGRDLSEVLTRAKFEELNVDLFRRTMKPIEQALKDAGLKGEDIDEVRVPIAGSCVSVSDFRADCPSGRVHSHSQDSADAEGLLPQRAIPRRQPRRSGRLWCGHPGRYYWRHDGARGRWSHDHGC